MKLAIPLCAILILMPALSIANERSETSAVYPLGVDPVDKYTKVPFSFDKDGVLQIADQKYGDQPIYHPTSIARYALDLHADLVKTADSSLLDKALAQTDYLAKEMLGGCDTISLLRYPYPGSYNLKPGWGSAMGQGLAIGALSLLYTSSSDRKLYERAINCGLKAFEVDVFDGGVQTALDTEAWWYEEYPAPQRPRVLNGHIFALSGLYAASKIGNEKAAALLSKGINAVNRQLKNYDAGFSSWYSQDEASAALSPRRYNKVHVDQLLWLWQITGDRLYFDYASRFLSYQDKRLKSFSLQTRAGHRADGGVLDDAATFFGRVGFGARELPVHALLETENPTVATRLAVFSYGLTGPLQGIRLYAEHAKSRHLIDLEYRSDLQYQNVSGNHETTVHIYDIASHKPTANYRATFTAFNVPSNRRLVLREIDIHFNQDGEAYKRYLELSDKNGYSDPIRDKPD